MTHDIFMTRFYNGDDDDNEDDGDGGAGVSNLTMTNVK